MAKKAILVASFGTTFDDTREKNITAVEKEFEKTFREYKIYSAFTSGMVRKSLAKRGIETFDAETILQKMAQDGMTEIIIQPTHLLYGDEFDKLCTQVIEKEYLFKNVKFSSPLLGDIEDMKKVLKVLTENIKLDAGECLVLMGHGTNHFCNTVYSALDYLAKAEKMEYLFVGTLEAYPDIDTVLSQVKKAGYKKVLITPLMLVAGDHATNDMASSKEDSWKSKFEANGIKTRCEIKGLGEYPEIRKLYCAHTLQAIGEN